MLSAGDPELPTAATNTLGQHRPRQYTPHDRMGPGALLTWRSSQGLSPTEESFQHTKDKFNTQSH